jgi:ribosomal protein RSM22 (predicted rRNA methylase)
MSDNVNHPKHYAAQGEIECITVLEQLAKDGNDFRIINAIKYLWRWKHKGGVEDLKKAIWYIQRTIDNA